MTDWSPTSPLNDRPPLYRSPERTVAGVAGGIADYFSVNALAVRALFGVFALAAGAGFLLYLALWVLLPLPPHLSGKSEHERSTRSLILGGGMLAMAAILAVVAIGGFDVLRFIMLALLFVGIALLNRRAAGATPAPSVAMPIPPPTEAVVPPPIDDVFTTDAMFATPSPAEMLQDPIAEVADAEPPATVDLDFPPPDATADMDQLETTELDVTTLAPEVRAGDETDADADAGHDADATADMDQLETTELEGTAFADATDAPDPTAQMPASPVDRLDLPDPPELPIVDPIPASPVPPTNPVPPTDPAPPLPDGGGHRVDPVTQRAHWAVTKTAEETSLTAGQSNEGAISLAPIALAAVLAVLGVALVLNTLAGIFIGAVTVSGISLAFVGTAIAITSYRGSTFPLVPIAFAASLALLVSPTIDHALQDGTGSRELDIDTVAELDRAYVLGVGGIELDLRDLELTEDVTVDVEVGTGYIEVWVPRGLAVELNAEADVGYVGFGNNGRGGFSPRLRLRPPASTDPDAPRLFLNTKNVIGGTDVYRG